MATKRNKTGNRLETKRLDELESDFKLILARYRGEEYDLAESDAAIVCVDTAFGKVAVAILRRHFPATAEALGANALLLWWRDMLKKNGGFSRYDGVRPMAHYALSWLKCICFGRENLRDQYHRRVAVREPKDERRNPNAVPDGTANVDRRQVPLEFDPIDRDSTDHAVQQRDVMGEVWHMLDQTPNDERELLIRCYIDGENLSALARERGINPRTMHTRLNRARQAFRERFPDFEW